MFNTIGGFNTVESAVTPPVDPPNPTPSNPVPPASPTPAVADMFMKWMRDQGFEGAYNDALAAFLRSVQEP